MKTDFDNSLSRIGTLSIKWEKNLNKFGKKDVIPLWIADMDFATPQVITNALSQRLEHPVFGYSFRASEYVDSIINWLLSRHGWQVKASDLLFYPPGTVPALDMLVRLLTEPGDEVIVQVPSYPPLMKVVAKNNRVLVENPLIAAEEGYQMDFEHLERCFTRKTKLLILCSPHNPTGRVWEKNELLKLAELCKENNVTVISDEVHADLIFSNTKHWHFNRLDRNQRPSSISIISSCKTFNIAGLPQSTLICDDESLKRKIQFIIDTSQLNLDGIFSAVATTAGYQSGGEWLDGLLEYLKANRDYLCHRVSEDFVDVSVVPAQGTYLAWLDFRKLELENKVIEQMLIQKAGVGLYNGLEFGKNGRGFFRLNFACPRSILDEALNKLVSVFG
ncbi:MalY/PatB family protein [Aliikangiella coralliicola]|uniref:cysteine-S-conjugate beta-lyase n=1 Tax=Aliikangiella coralliicola TaxID=2592383 RepID=A0A545UHR3_9GAMM|nr:PatB family C-S lyase [Aliikangiella coralliicola]TQV89011.1 putative C-S lyase [Aliikangiella coralliicola]